MWEMITEMSTNRLWIWTGIGGSIFGALFIVSPNIEIAGTEVENLIQ